MIQNNIFTLIVCLLLPCFAIEPRLEANSAKQVALVALAFDNGNRDLAIEGVFGFAGYEKRLSRELARRGWEVQTLSTSLDPRLSAPPDEVPNEKNLRDYFKRLSKLHSNDSLLVILVGNMVSLEAKSDGRITSPRLYFCPEDAQYDKLGKADEVKTTHKLISFEDIYSSLKTCPARRKLLILVTATSTTLGEPANYPPPLVSRMPKLERPPQGLAVFTSCAEGEYTSTRLRFLEKIQEGVEGLKADGALSNRAKDGAVDVEELVSFVRSGIEEVGDRREIPQHPTLLSQLPRDWVLVGQATPSPWNPLTLPLPETKAKQRQAEVARALKRESPVMTDGLGLKLAIVPPGEYQMGSDKGYDDERPRPTVRLTRPFLLGVHEVTQAQYEKVMGHNPSAFRAVEGQDTSAFPVEQVTFKQAILFCNALSEREKLKPYYQLIRPRKEEKSGKVVDFEDYAPAGGRGYRLPTEAEWEWACRAGTDTAFSFGESLNGKQANIDDHRPGGVKYGAYLGRPTKVGSYAPNAWGLYDMYGNVAERVEESYDPTRYKLLSLSVTDGSGGVGYGGLARGGAWNFAAKDCRSTVRLALPPDTALKFVGFRVARDAE